MHKDFTDGSLVHITIVPAVPSQSISSGQEHISFPVPEWGPLSTEAENGTSIFISALPLGSPSSTRGPLATGDQDHHPAELKVPLLLGTADTSELSVPFKLMPALPRHAGTTRHHEKGVCPCYLHPTQRVMGKEPPSRSVQSINRSCQGCQRAPCLDKDNSGCERSCTPSWELFHSVFYE